MEKPKSGIVAAVGVSASSLSPSGKGLAKMIEAAMSQAVLDAAKAGITDDAEIRELMQQARRKVVAAVRAPVEHVPLPER